MASTRKIIKKTGQVGYEIIVSRGRSSAPLTMRWYAPAGWSQRAIDRELVKVAAEFERQCKAGDVLSRAEKAEQKRQEAMEDAQIKTLREYCKSVYMPALTVRCSENTRDSYQRNLNNWILPAIGDFKLPDITAAQITAILVDMQSKKKSHSTVIKVYTILHGIFKAAYLADLVDRNVMDKVERPKPRKDERRDTTVQSYTVEEVVQILHALKNEPLKWQVFVRLLIDTGIRRGECCGLRWKDVDFKAGTITICGNLCYTKEKGIYLDTPKNGQCRTIDIDPYIMHLLKKLRNESGTTLTGYVFTQDGSTDPMHPQSPTRFLTGFSKRCGISGIHPHKLRHSFASIAITNGADIASVSEKLGHSDKAVTLRMYTHADAESIKRAGQIFRDAIKKKQA